MAEKRLKFKTQLVGTEESSATALIAPPEVMEVFATKARVPVRGTINGYPFRSSLMPMGGCHKMAVNKTMRDGAKVTAGDVVEVVLERDVAERTVEAPAELKKELAKNKAARERWDASAYTVKKEMARSITEAKQEETKKRRLAKVMDVLKSGKKWQ